MKRIITKAQCKSNGAKKVNSPKGLKLTYKNGGLSPLKSPASNFNADMLMNEILFSRVLFSEQLALRNIKNNKLFILENCSLYNVRRFSQTPQ